jgi:hypothetical protein
MTTTRDHGTINLADGTCVVLAQEPCIHTNNVGDAVWIASGYLSTETPAEETGPTVMVTWASLGATESEDDANWDAPVSVQHYSRGELATA